jgi:hypothetical protein
VTRVELIGGAFDGSLLNVDDDVRQLDVVYYGGPQPWDFGRTATRVGIETYRRVTERTFDRVRTPTAVGDFGDRREEKDE